MINSLTYAVVVQHLFAKYKARIVKKTDSSLMKIIDALLKVITLGSMRSFMTDFVTTIGTTIYVPKDWEDRHYTSNAITLRHEMVHIEQKKRMGMLLFTLKYLFWVLPGGLAIGRRDLEAEAYEETMYGWAQFRGAQILNDAQFKKSILDNFTSSSYFWMYPFRKWAESWYAEASYRVRARLHPTDLV